MIGEAPYAEFQGDAADLSLAKEDVEAVAAVKKAGVPVVPGSDGSGQDCDGSGLDDDALARAAERIGYPVLLKPSAGGGGKGMREVHRAEDLADAISSANFSALLWWAVRGDGDDPAATAVEALDEVLRGLPG